MSQFKDSRGGDDNLERKKLHLDTMAQLGQERKQRIYAALGVKPGSYVLDVGCGVGADTLPLAQLVGPTGRVVGIDRDSAAITEAQHRAAQAGVNGWAEHRVVDANVLPFDDNTFDACHSERVFMHLERPEVVLAEIVRVTKSGGRIVLIDPDGASMSMNSDEAEIERRLLPVWSLLQKNPYAGRRALRLFKRLGVEDVTVTIEPAVNRDLEMARYIAKMDDMLEKGVALGLISQEEVERFNADIEQAAALDATLAYMCMITTVGRKP